MVFVDNVNRVDFGKQDRATHKRELHALINNSIGRSFLFRLF